jgi:hypothetical protein
MFSSDTDCMYEQKRKSTAASRCLWQGAYCFEIKVALPESSREPQVSRSSSIPTASISIFTLPGGREPLILSFRRFWSLHSALTSGNKRQAAIGKNPCFASIKLCESADRSKLAKIPGCGPHTESLKVRSGPSPRSDEPRGVNQYVPAETTLIEDVLIKAKVQLESRSRIIARCFRPDEFW